MGLPHRIVKVCKSQKCAIRVRRSRAPNLDVPPSTRLTWQVEKNPKIKGSAAHKRFQKYRKAKTVSDFQRLGGWARDLRIDRDRGFVKFSSRRQRDSASAASGETPQPQQAEIKVACIGDSNTTGAGLKSSSYPNRLQIALNTWRYYTGRGQGLGHIRFSVKGFGFSGAHAVPGPMGYGSHTKLASALAWKADINVIMLGTNDTHQASGEPGKVEQSLEALVKKMRAAHRDCTPILVLPPGSNSKRCIRDMENIVHPGIRRLGKKLCLTVVEPRLKPHYHLREDRIHLSAAGAQTIATKVKLAIIKVVKVAQS